MEATPSPQLLGTPAMVSRAGYLSPIQGPRFNQGMGPWLAQGTESQKIQNAFFRTPANTCVQFYHMNLICIHL